MKKKEDEYCKFRGSFKCILQNLRKMKFIRKRNKKNMYKWEKKKEDQHTCEKGKGKFIQLNINFNIYFNLSK